MKVSRVIQTMVCLALMGATFSPSAKADAWDKKTTITFSGPVQIPAVHQPGWGVLPAGTYVFRVVDSASDRHIVQIFSKDETTIYATILAIPNLRMKSTDKTVITFRERPAGQPPALQAWFYPGKEWGEEFVYPKAQAVELARVDQYTRSRNAGHCEGGGRETRSTAGNRGTEGSACHGSRALGKRGRNRSGCDPSAGRRDAGGARATLPKTASPLPLIALLGLLALGGGLTLRFAGTRIR